MKQKIGSLFQLFTLTITTLLVVALRGTTVYAGSSTIMPPFDIGSSWYICQGYNNPRGTHTGISSLSLDITGGPECDNSAAGRTVRSPFAGKVYWYTQSSGSLCINSNDNRSIMLTHIDSSAPISTVVTAGQVVGVIAPPYQRANNGVAHLHLQAWSVPGCPQDGSSQVPFDSASGMRMCGAPDMTINGPNPYNNGTWSGMNFIAQSCVYITQKPPGSIYRFWSDRYMGHFYTSDYNEAQRVADTWPDTWSYEPSANFTITLLSTSQLCPTDDGVVPVYRFWSDIYRKHFYTADLAEKDRVIATWPNIWSYEGPKFCASPTQTNTYSKPLYRFWSDRYMGHFYTADEAEANRVRATWPDVWKYEGPKFYVK